MLRHHDEGLWALSTLPWKPLLTTSKESHRSSVKGNELLIVKIVQTGPLLLVFEDPLNMQVKITITGSEAQSGRPDLSLLLNGASTGLGLVVLHCCNPRL